MAGYGATEGLILEARIRKSPPMQPVTKAYLGTAARFLVGAGVVALVAYLKLYCGFG